MLYPILGSSVVIIHAMTKEFESSPTALTVLCSDQLSYVTILNAVGVEPTMFTLRDRFYRPMQNHHLCSASINMIFILLQNLLSSTEGSCVNFTLDQRRIELPTDCLQSILAPLEHASP